MEEDDMVMRVGSSLVRRRADEESKEGCRPEELPGVHPSKGAKSTLTLNDLPF